MALSLRLVLKYDDMNMIMMRSMAVTLHGRLIFVIFLDPTKTERHSQDHHGSSTNYSQCWQAITTVIHLMIYS